MTIENERAFLDGIWDWVILDGCFGETRIKPTDIDGLVERNGYFLMLECKSPGVPVKHGQALMLNRAVATGFFTAMIVWGQQNSPEKLVIIRSSETIEIDPCSLNDFRAYVYQWFLHANQQKLGMTARSILTRNVVEMFDCIQSNIETNNRFLL